MTQRRIYQEKYPYFVTWRTREGYRLFEETRMAELLSEIMFVVGRMKRYNILAYQIMPDHVHMLVYRLDGNAGGDTRVRRVDGQRLHPHTSRVSAPAMTHYPSPAVASKHHMSAMGQSNDQPTISDLMYTIKSYFIKQIRVQYDIRYSVWHSRFYARIVNNRRYLHMVVEYIKHNPIKAELPRQYHTMPYQFIDLISIGYLF